MCGAEYWTDHRLVRTSTTVWLQIRPVARKQKPSKKLNLLACNDPAIQRLLQQKIQEKLQHISDVDPLLVRDPPSLLTEWDSFCKGLQETSVETLGFHAKNHQDWFDDKMTI